jgi:hypothetical protein
MAVRHPEAVQQLSGSAVRAESRSGGIGPISLEAKQTGERSAGNPHAAFDVAGIGNVAWSRCCDTRRRKSETTGNTNIDLHRRASPRPYVRPAKAGMFSRRKACRGKSQGPRSLDSRVAGNQGPEAYRQGLPRGDHESPGRNDSERECGLEIDWIRGPSPHP